MSVGQVVTSLASRKRAAARDAIIAAVVKTNIVRLLACSH